MSSNIQPPENPKEVAIRECKDALIKVEDDIDSIEIIRYENLDIPELYDITEQALTRLKE